MVLYFIYVNGGAIRCVELKVHRPGLQRQQRYELEKSDPNLNLQCGDLPKKLGSETVTPSGWTYQASFMYYSAEFDFYT